MVADAIVLFPYFIVKFTVTCSVRQIGTVEALIDTIKFDKDEAVKTTCEAALIRIADKWPDEVLSLFCDYRNNNKIDNGVTACILR